MARGKESLEDQQDSISFWMS